MIESQGRVGLQSPTRALDCSDSGTTMRLLAGVLAANRFESVLEGDESLSSRPMERVAEPLRAMGADVRTTDGHAPIVVRGAPLRGIEHRSRVPSAQVKGAVLLAGLAATGQTTVREAAPTRDHTERALAHLGAPIVFEPGRASVRAFQHHGFAGVLPGDISSAAFLVGGGVLGGETVAIEGVGLNPTRTWFLKVLKRMGVTSRVRTEAEELGEPVGMLEVEPPDGLLGTRVTIDELPLVIDEVPILAFVAAHASGETRFMGASELKVKESDRLHGLAEAILAAGGVAEVQGDDLIVGGGGLDGGVVDPRGDHRIAMAATVGAIGARTPIAIEGIEAADVSFPGFVQTLGTLGARIEI